MKDEKVIGSRRITVNVRETYEIILPPKHSREEMQEAIAELKTYARLIGQDVDANVYLSRKEHDPEIKILTVRGPSSATGLDYNQTVYSNIVWVEDNV